MKEISKFMFLLLVLMSLVTNSCNNEAIFEEEIAEVVDPPKEEEDNDDNDDNDDIDVTEPCDFTLEGLEANSTVVIDCILDLDGKTINLPNNVTIEYEGGDIINGTINFDGGIIDGNLLNSTLIIGGTKPQLKDPVFNFNPERWGIVQGETTSEIAQRNNNILEDLMNESKNMGVNTFKIDELDAYFEVGKVTSKTSNQNFYATVEAINVPSDFNLVMTENTHLRVFPNDAPKYCLLALRDVDNVTVTGGNLYGDRDEHDYSSGGTHEWGNVMQLHAATNSTISNVRMLNGSGDGMKISSLRFTFQENYAPSHDILVQNCTFDSNRRNNISVTDGFDITIENNLLLNAGVDTSKSTGTPPKFGIDVEAVRTSDGNGGYIHYERAEDIFIRNNTERGSAAGAITVHIGYKVIIEGNTTENSLSYTYTYGTKIINNTVNGNGGTGIKGGKNLETADSIYDNEISGNTITGFNTGINVQNRDVLVYDNIINDFSTGISPINLKNSRIYNNTMVSSRDDSRGFFINRTTLDGVVIENNDITSKANAIKISTCNFEPEAANYSVTFDNNTFKSSAYSQIKDARGVIFKNNSFNHGVEIYDSQNIDFNGNNISTQSHDGIYLRDINQDIDLISNSIDVASNRDCVRIDSTTSSSEVNDSNNDCL
ncbi:right-handed parallel beta-helix repeat-containing protein [Flavivirga sp. 57AJ16]|uniref:right-handed parallel beta-helix repeat-containing protein n=1 Tax=Flavivirga sp. 57AJ16 TaxID=3025307 RepID=UPI002366BFF4|nr:right-handed parallel beta-helix repeat-containing protein [Flavivirga sp. 57AJ16]MDD7885834.1 right-handed parallel beta-helix repeat-containing protein [Flavivirga sp. 57AJ16]